MTLVTMDTGHGHEVLIAYKPFRVGTADVLNIYIILVRLCQGLASYSKLYTLDTLFLQ
jgi:hypothetical protein